MNSDSFLMKAVRPHRSDVPLLPEKPVPEHPWDSELEIDEEFIKAETTQSHNLIVEIGFTLVMFRAYPTTSMVLFFT